LDGDKAGFKRAIFIDQPTAWQGLDQAAQLVWHDLRNRGYQSQRKRRAEFHTMLQHAQSHLGTDIKQGRAHRSDEIECGTTVDRVQTMQEPCFPRSVFDRSGGMVGIRVVNYRYARMALETPSLG